MGSGLMKTAEEGVDVKYVADVIQFAMLNGILPEDSSRELPACSALYLVLLKLMSKANESDIVVNLDHIEEYYSETLQTFEVSEDDFEDGVYNKSNSEGSFSDKDLFIKCEEGIENLADWSFLQRVEKLTGKKIKALKAPNNAIHSTCSSLLQCLTQTKLSYLNIGSNPLVHLDQMITYFPRDLLVLDLSFCEDLMIPSNCLIYCPLLKSLSLEGCGLQDTCRSVGVDAKSSISSLSSIFYGLVQLQELNLKENNLSTLEACQGLLYFSMDHATPSRVEREVGASSIVCIVFV